MNETWLHPDEVERLRRMLFCTWVGLLYGVCALAVTNVSWPVFFLIVAMVTGSNYLGVARRSLLLVAPAVLFVTLLALVGLLPTPDDLQNFAHNPMRWLRRFTG